ncbi:uncharacterized protein BJ171DRAFT_580546 [Polychytrium aggregatum]|uniref:uncharacterized protein n=1 Tax=Polychytrium aggregatum TaxID=110093 RepID=UPI0022FE4CB0|nr:uncharacterized protein BJ171DRAFT_580546 [Polychytrium aggregatum]KAI9205897.1 hypothetical protein BJ171DRAFT_580546 [Polychytrium aggregatum]
MQADILKLLSTLIPPAPTTGSSVTGLDDKLALQSFLYRFHLQHFGCAPPWSWCRSDGPLSDAIGSDLYGLTKEWGALCHPCRLYWACSYLKGGSDQGGYLGPGPGETETPDCRPPHDPAYLYEEDPGCMATEQKTVDSPDAGQADDVELTLTPEVIEMFRHSERFRLEREKEKRLEQEAQAQKEQRDLVKAEEQRLKRSQGQTTLYGRLEQNQAIDSLEAYLNHHHQIQQQQLKPVRWPILPIRMIFD